MTLTHEERVALTFIAHNDPRDGFVRRTWLEFKTAICGLLQRTRANGWIPVSERLPEAGETVLLWNYVDHRLGWLKYTANGAAYFFSTQDECNIEPTHWMPLPEPPEVNLSAEALAIAKRVGELPVKLWTKEPPEVK
jgi:hypothetical protein